MGKFLIAFNHLCPPPCFVTFSLLLTPEILERLSALRGSIEADTKISTDSTVCRAFFIDLNPKNHILKLCLLVCYLLAIDITTNEEDSWQHILSPTINGCIFI